MQKLEIGPSANRRTPDGKPLDTWDTLDCEGKVTYEARWGFRKLPISENTYDWVHASHTLEHIPWWLTQDALREAYRIIRPGGRFTVWVPDAIKIINEAQRDPAAYAEREKGWACGGKNPSKSPWVYMNARVFWGARRNSVGQSHHFHCAMFGEKSLVSLLSGAGFKRVRLIERDKKVDPGHGWMEVGAEGFK